MKIIICDKCGATNIPMSPHYQFKNKIGSDEQIDSIIAREFDEYEGYDLCRTCSIEYRKNRLFRIQQFIGYL